MQDNSHARAKVLRGSRNPLQDQMSPVIYVTLLLLSGAAMCQSLKGPLSVPEFPWPQPASPLQDVPPQATENAIALTRPILPASFPPQDPGVTTQEQTELQLPASARGLVPHDGPAVTPKPLFSTSAAADEAAYSSENLSHGPAMSSVPSVPQGDSGTVFIPPRDGPPAFGSDAAASFMITSPPGPALPSVPGARRITLLPRGSPRLPSMQPSPTPGLGANASEAKPTICSNNPLTFFPSGSTFPTFCRVYLYADPNRSSFILCTGWFVGLTFVATAGHCIAHKGTGVYLPVNVNGRYGTVCCQTQVDTDADNCADGYGLDIVGFAATNGWLNLGRDSNDGAVLVVRRPANLAAGIGTPVTYGQQNPRCYSGTVTYLGYPAQDTTEPSCNRDFGEQLAAGQASGLIQCTTNVNSPTYVWDGSSCGGMSGGPLYDSTNFFFGILSAGGIFCTAGSTELYFTAVVNAGVDYGVCISCLVSQLGGPSPPPPSPPPQPLPKPPPPPPATCLPPQYIPNGAVPNARFLSGVGGFRHRQTCRDLGPPFGGMLRCTIYRYNPFVLQSPFSVSF